MGLGLPGGESSPLVSGPPSLCGYVGRHVPLIPGAGQAKEKEMLLISKKNQFPLKGPLPFSAPLPRGPTLCDTSMC